MKIKLLNSLILFVTLGVLALLSCEKKLDFQHQDLNNSSLIKNWQINNTCRSLVSVENFVHNLSFSSAQPFLKYDNWHLPAQPLITGQTDSFKVYPILSYNKLLEKSSYIITLYIVPHTYRFLNHEQLIEDFYKNNDHKKIKVYTTKLFENKKGEFTKDGETLAVRKTQVSSRNAPLDGDCEIVQIDWYWQTWVDGVLISEEYLFTTNEILCSPGGGGGGDSTLTSTSNPCDSMYKLANNAAFKAKLESLKNKTTGNKEYATVFKNTTANGFDEWNSEGDANALGVDYHVSPNEKIDGVMHNHFFIDGKSISVFSIADMNDLINLYRDGNINDPNSFSITLVSQSGFQYQLRIQNMEEFAGFAQKFQIKEDLELLMRMYPILEDKTGYDYSAQNELNFLKFLQASKSGLKFFKKDPGSNNWNSYKHSAGQQIADPCN